MRGLPHQNNLILVLVDGIQINELNSGGFYGGRQYNLANVERIEVVYGPASALYGTNAVSGVINIITHSAVTETGARARGWSGTFAERGLDASYGLQKNDGRLGIHLAGMIRHSEKADLAGEDCDNNWTDTLENYEDDYAFDARVNYDSVSAGLTFQQKVSSRSTIKRAVDTPYVDHGSQWNIRFINAWLKHEWQTSDNLHVETRAYFRDTTVLPNSISAVTDTAQFGYYRPNDLTGLEVTGTWTPRDNLIMTAGLVLEEEHLAKTSSNTSSNGPNAPPPEPPDPEQFCNQLLSFYCQGQFAPHANFLLTAGLRWDDSSVYEKVTTPRLGLLFHSGGFSSKLLFMEAFRAPKPWDYTWNDGNPNLLPEKMQSVELATSYGFHDRWHGELSLYQNRIDNLLAMDSTASRWINLGEISTQGLELSLHWRGPQFAPFISYTYTNSEDENGAGVPEIARHTASGGMLWQAHRKWRIYLSGHFVGERENNDVVPDSWDDVITSHHTIAAYLTSGLTVTWDAMQDIKIQGQVRNLTDTEYYHPSNRQLISRWRQPQRSFLLRVIWQPGGAIQN